MSKEKHNRHGVGGIVLEHGWSEYFTDNFMMGFWEWDISSHGMQRKQRKGMERERNGIWTCVCAEELAYRYPCFYSLFLSGIWTCTSPTDGLMTIMDDLGTLFSSECISYQSAICNLSMRYVFCNARLMLLNLLKLTYNESSVAMYISFGVY